MKINFPSFRKSNSSYQTINQAYRSMQSVINKKTYTEVPASCNYLKSLNRQTHNQNWFQKMFRTIKIMFSSGN